jgi:hypothetical protein
MLSAKPTPSPSPFTDALTLTPVRRKKLRPSFGPRKTPSQATPKARARSESPGCPVSTSQPEVFQKASYDIETAALDFKEFSFWGEDGQQISSNISPEHHKAMMLYLGNIYDVMSIYVAIPYMVLYCESEVPPEDRRPFSVAGLIAVWTLSGGEMEEISPVNGSFGDADAALEIPAMYIPDLQGMKVPKPETLLFLAQEIFTDCEAISSIATNLVVELPAMEPEAFYERLQDLPSQFRGSSRIITYNNGPLPNTEFKRHVKPEPRYINGVADETDYTNEHGCFYPGAMISALDKDDNIYGFVSAGILVEKEGSNA